MHLPIFAALLSAAFAIPVVASPLWDEAAIIKSIGHKVVAKKGGKDDGCMVTRYFFHQSPDVQVEFKCNRINIGWQQFKDPGSEQKDKTAAAIATRVAAVLSNGSGREVNEAMGGSIIRKRPTSTVLSVGGSCQFGMCLLTYQ